MEVALSAASTPEEIAAAFQRMRAVLASHPVDLAAWEAQVAQWLSAPPGPVNQRLRRNLRPR